MINASAAPRTWARLTGEEQSLFRERLKATPDRGAAIRSFLEERTGAVAVLGAELVDAVGEYLRLRGRPAARLRAQVAARLAELEFRDWRDAVDLIHLHTICCHFGVVALGQAFRQAARQCVLDAYRGSDRSSDDADLLALVIGAAFETGKPKLVQRAAADLLRVAPSHPILVCLARLGLSEADAGPSLAENETYAAFLRDRRVAVVGPAAVRDDASKPQLDGFSILATMNAKAGSLRDFMPAGAAHVSFYNVEQAEHLIASKTPTPDHLDWSVLKQRRHRNAFDALNRKPGYQSRVMRRSTPLMFNGVPNALQNLLFDLATFEPKAVHVCLCDFMLSFERQKGYFPPEWNREGDRKMRSVVRRTFALKHDPVSQFLFTRTLVKLRGVSTDARLTEILGYSEQAFSLAVERAYRAPTGK